MSSIYFKQNITAGLGNTFTLYIIKCILFRPSQLMQSTEAYTHEHASVRFNALHANNDMA